MTMHILRTRFLLPLVLIGLLLSACGAAAPSPETDEAPVEAPATIDEPVVIEEPDIIEEAEAIEQPPVQVPAADHAVYPGAEFVSRNNWGPQVRVNRYVTDASLDDVVAFYQAQYPYLIFSVSGSSATGAPEEGEDAWLETGVVNVWIYRTDEDYFNQMAFMPSSYIPADVLEAMPRNMTLIEIHGTN